MWDMGKKGAIGKSQELALVERLGEVNNCQGKENVTNILVRRNF